MSKTKESNTCQIGGSNAIRPGMTIGENKGNSDDQTEMLLSGERTTIKMVR